MKYRFICGLVGAFLLLSGCSSEKESPKVASESYEVIKQVDGTQQVDPKKQSSSPRGVASTEAATLSELTEKAQSLDSEFKFDESAKIWRAVESQTKQKFGDEAWQTRNAKIAREFAEQAATFDRDRSAKLRSIRSHVNNTAQLATGGEFALALQSAQLAHNRLAELLGTESVQYGRQIIELAALQMQVGKLDDAIKNYHQGIQILTDKGMSIHPEVEQAHARLAALYSQKRRFEQAVANQKTATRIAETVWGENSESYALQANQLGVIFHRAGQHETALKILEASEAIRRINLGENSLQVAHSRLNIGIVQQDLRRYDDALASYENVRQILTDTSNTDDAAYVQCQSKSATIYMLKNDLAMAEMLLDSIIQNLSQQDEVQPETLAMFEYRLSIALAKQGKYDRAQPMLERVMAVQKQNIGEEHPATIKTMKAYALVLKQTKQTERAEQVYQQIRHVAAKNNSNDFQR